MLPGFLFVYKLHEQETDQEYEQRAYNNAEVDMDKRWQSPPVS